MLRKIAVQTYEETFAADNTPGNNALYIADAFSHEKLESELDNPASTFYLALEDGEAIGYVKPNDAPAQTDLNDEQSLEIERIYVAKQFHGTGCGRRLLEKAIACAVEGGRKYIWLGVWEHNPRAIRFYEKTDSANSANMCFNWGMMNNLIICCGKIYSLWHFKKFCENSTVHDYFPGCDCYRERKCSD